MMEKELGEQPFLVKIDLWSLSPKTLTESMRRIHAYDAHGNPSSVRSRACSRAAANSTRIWLPKKRSPGAVLAGVGSAALSRAGGGKFFSTFPAITAT